MNKTTESDSYYDSLEQMSTADLLANINKEDKTVAHTVEKQIPQIEKLVNAIVPKMEKGGRLFYIGAGTSGRLGIVDASECPPTFGVVHGLVIGIMAGDYQITVTDSSNCVGTDSISIIGESADCFNIPNGFTPNFDGTNDIWNIRGASNFPKIKVEVFNRWGTRIFSSKGYAKPWDGTYNGKELPAAVYYYIITLDKKTDYSGSVTIFR